MIRPRLHMSRLSVYGLAELSVAPGKRLISLAQNESPFPPSPAALDAAAQTASTGALYPDPSCRALREAIGQVHGLDPDRLIHAHLDTQCFTHGVGGTRTQGHCGRIARDHVYHEEQQQHGYRHDDDGQPEAIEKIVEHQTTGQP